jgi:exonuclease 1
MKRVALLQEFNIKPLIVFDGGKQSNTLPILASSVTHSFHLQGYLPLKGVTEKDRKSKREENRRLGLEAFQAGNKSKAAEYFQKCVDIKPSMAKAWIEELKKARVEYIVAPYEADAQLAYLEKIGLADAVLTEDSDLLVFGCKRVQYIFPLFASKCNLSFNQVVLKLDAQGNAMEIQSKDLPRVRLFRNGWSFDKFVRTIFYI